MGLAFPNACRSGSPQKSWRWTEPSSFKCNWKCWTRVIPGSGHSRAARTMMSLWGGSEKQEFNDLTSSRYSQSSSSTGSATEEEFLLFHTEISPPAGEAPALQAHTSLQGKSCKWKSSGKKKTQTTNFNQIFKTTFQSDARLQVQAESGSPLLREFWSSWNFLQPSLRDAAVTAQTRCAAIAASSCKCHLLVWNILSEHS